MSEKNFLGSPLLITDQDFQSEKNFLGSPLLITDQDFQKVDIEYFYENLLYSLTRNTEGKIKNTIKWGITFDKKCTPIKVAWANPNYTGNQPKLKYEDNKGKSFRSFGTIDINGRPIFYYLYFTMQELLDAIRASK